MRCQPADEREVPLDEKSGGSAVAELRPFDELLVRRRKGCAEWPPS